MEVGDYRTGVNSKLAAALREIEGKDIDWYRLRAVTRYSANKRVLGI